jgi:hypothetical protein
MTNRANSIRIFLLLMLLAVTSVSGVSAQVGTLELPVQATTSAKIDFPRGIDFSTTVDVPDEFEPDRAEFYYRPTADLTLNLVFVPASGVGEIDTGVSAAVSIDLQTNYLPSGIDLTYFWRLFDASGNSIDSEPEQVTWADPRFEWSAYSTDQVRLYTYALSPEFAQSAVDIAQQTVTSLEQRFGLDRSEPVSIWVYDTSTDFQPTQRSNSREAVAGISHAGFFVIHVVMANNNTREVGRTITHEISHQVLYQATRNPYSGPPLWFDEGMATHAQTEGIDGYLPLAITAANTGALFSLTSLEATFPYLPADASISYAISWSAVEYILETWGDDGIAALIQGYATGQPDEDVMQSALGITPAELDAQLRDWLLSQSRDEAA